MDEEISIIDTKTRNEKIKNFFVENKKLLLSIVVFLLVCLLSFYAYQIYTDNLKEKISDQYNNAIIDYNKEN